MFASSTSYFKHCTSGYLSKCDQINKLSIDNLKKSPRVRNVILSLCLGEASSMIGDSSRDQKLNSFLMLYLLGFRKPIFFVSRPTKVSDKNFFKLEILLSKKSGMHEFLLDLFLEDRLILRKESDDETDACSKELSENGAVLFKTEVDMESFLSISKFIDKEIIDTRLKKLRLTIAVVVQDPEIEA